MIFYFKSLRSDFTDLYASKYLKLYTYSQPAGRKMNSKTKTKVYRKVIDEVTKEYEGADEFIRNKIKKLCSEHRISIEEIRLYIFVFVMLRTQFSYVHSLE